MNWYSCSPNLKTIETLGINRYFPKGFTLNFVPLVPPPVGSTPEVIAAHELLVREEEIADYELPSLNASALASLNHKLLTYMVAQLSDGTYPAGTVIFTKADTANMALMTAQCTLEEKRFEKEIDLIGPFLLKLKSTLSPELASSVESTSKSDRKLQDAKIPPCGKYCNT